MCMSCSGNSNTPRSATSKSYNPQSAPKQNYHHRQNVGTNGNQSRSSAFGTPKIKFSGKK